APEAADALRARMAAWAAIADARGPWLRSLRPPPVPLDAPVLEEYRTDVRGALVFADDDAVLGVAEAPDAVWERATGHRVVRILAEPPQTPQTPQTPPTHD